MAGNERFEDSIGKWLEEAAPTRLPGRVLDATFERTRRTRQETAWRMVPGRLHMPRFIPALGGAAIVVAAAVLALNVMPLIGPGASPEPTATSPAVFTEIAPGEFVEMPDWPLTHRTTPPMVWTGTELIVWGDGIYGRGDDGAAFSLANGTWRVIAEAPLGPRCCHAAAWTGTEMLVWGGRDDNTFFYDGAAYNPVTDAWRLLPRAGSFLGKDPTMVWTGDVAVVLGVSGNADTSGEYIAAATYDPAENTWRTLARAPDSVRIGPRTWWTGDSIVVADVAPNIESVARYDLAADRWTTLNIEASAAVVGIVGADGDASAFVNLPSERGAPVQVIDSAGGVIDELPAFPGDPGVFGDEIGASGVWVGSDAVFEIFKVPYDEKPGQVWALNPGTQTWRRLDGEMAFPRVDYSMVAAGDLLLTWNRPSDVYQGRVCCVAPPSSGGAIYRIGTPSPTAQP